MIPTDLVEELPGSQSLIALGLRSDFDRGQPEHAHWHGQIPLPALNKHIQVVGPLRFRVQLLLCLMRESLSRRWRQDD